MNDALRMLKIIKGIDLLFVKNHLMTNNDDRRYVRILYCCLYCSISEFDRENPHEMWSKLWDYLATQNVDVEAVKADLRLSVEKNGHSDSCIPYGGDDILKIIAIHLIPVSVQI